MSLITSGKSIRRRGRGIESRLVRRAPVHKAPRSYRRFGFLTSVNDSNSNCETFESTDECRFLYHENKLKPRSACKTTRNIGFRGRPSQYADMEEAFSLEL
ncbi:hypothetical protein EVAR_75520_1 [Eumeta japonica]|uniref:Uncharacterized protein n=1 Tax=Eumeta variegata TaxID=151549 RepID=A0A4C1UIY9_EUMVA|nr:hypothetical protein EVAR_75520_1 [Eumeta japonica]